MKKFNLHILFSLVIIILSGNETFCLGEENTTMFSNEETNLVESVQNKEMRKALVKSLEIMKEARKQLEFIRTEISEGKLAVKNNNGLWQAITEDQTTLYLVRCQSESGPITFFMKRVWTDSSHKKEIHELGYEMYLGTNGFANMFMRRDGGSAIRYYPDGRVERFSVKTDGKQYSAEWGPDGSFMREGQGKGMIERIEKK